MAEFVSNEIQEVPANGDITFSDASVPYPYPYGSVMHRDGSGIVTLRGNSFRPFSVYRVSYSTNIAIPEDGTVEPLSISISLSGEALPTSTAIITPTAVDAYWHVTDTTDVMVPNGCCVQVAVKNTSTQAVYAQNSSLTVNKIA